MLFHTPVLRNMEHSTKSAKGAKADILLSQYLVVTLMVSFWVGPSVRWPTSNKLLPLDCELTWVKREDQIHLHHIYPHLVSWGEGKLQFFSFLLDTHYCNICKEGLGIVIMSTLRKTAKM